MEMARLTTCKRCGKPFASFGAQLCPACLEKEDEMFSAVRSYLDKNPGKNVSEIADATDVPVEVVTDFIARGRLVSVSAKAPGLFCRICKKPITSGQVCDKCRSLLDQASKGDGATSEEIKTGDRMYSRDFLSKRRK